MIFPNRQKFNFDAAIRYYPVVKIIEKGNFDKILEVGSGTNGISDYYCGQVIGVDSDFSKTVTVKNPNMLHKKGSILKIPFKDQSFPLVVCLDTLEHLAKEKRMEALKELLRVVKRGGRLILGFPCGNLNWLENIVNKLFKLTHGVHHPWLTEHKMYGLPREEEIKGFLRELNIKNSVEIIKNANILMWLKMHVIFTVLDKTYFTRILKFFYIPLFYIFKINLPPYYRSIFIIRK